MTKPMTEDELKLIETTAKKARDIMNRLVPNASDRARNSTADNMLTLVAEVRRLQKRLSDFHNARRFTDLDKASACNAQLEDKIKVLQKKLEIREATAHRFCPDCRDKVRDEDCLRCQRDALRNASLEDT